MKAPKQARISKHRISPLVFHEEGNNDPYYNMYKQVSQIFKSSHLGDWRVILPTGHTCRGYLYPKSIQPTL